MDHTYETLNSPLGSAPENTAQQHPKTLHGHSTLLGWAKKTDQLSPQLNMVKIIARACSLVTRRSKSLLERASGHLSARHHGSSMLLSSFGASWRSKSLLEILSRASQHSRSLLEHALFVLRKHFRAHFFCLRKHFRFFLRNPFWKLRCFGMCLLRAVLLLATSQPP